MTKAEKAYKSEATITGEKPKENEEKTISLPLAVFSAISLTIGAGMVAVPKTTIESGIPFGIAYNALNFVLTIYSIHLLLESARVTGLYSMPRLAFEWFGQFSLYIVNFAQFIAFGIMPIAYFIIFGGILSSFIREIPYVAHKEGFFLGTQWFSVLILAVIIFPLMIKKEISELSIAGALLFWGVILFNVLLLVLILDPNVELDYKPADSKVFYRFEFNQQLLSSLSTAFVAYAFQSGFFPIYNSIKNHNYSRGIQFSIYSMGFWFLIYVCIMFSGLYAFGIKIQGDALANLSTVYSWESYIIRGIFLLILLTHTPFTFFIGKESVLCLVVLIYSKFKSEKVEETETWTRSPLVRSFHSSPDSSSRLDIQNSKSKKNYRTMAVSISHKNAAEDASMRSAEMSIAKAIPFNQSFNKSLEVKSDKVGLDEENAPAHQLLPDSIYYPTTIILFALVVTTACIVNDVESVIKYVGSLGNAVLNFLIPGITYFIIMRKYERQTTSKWKLAGALSLAIYGGVLALICTGVNVWTTIDPLDDTY